MIQVRYYPVLDLNAEGVEKQAMIPALSLETVREHHRFWLEEIVPHYFRLCSSEPQSRETVSGFRIRCPYCAKLLRPISSAVRGSRLFLYECENCTRKEREK